MTVKNQSTNYAEQKVHKAEIINDSTDQSAPMIKISWNLLLDLIFCKAHAVSELLYIPDNYSSSAKIAKTRLIRTRVFDNIYRNHFGEDIPNGVYKLIQGNARNE